MAVRLRRAVRADFGAVAMERGSDDNVSAIVIQGIHKPPEPAGAKGILRGMIGRLRRR